MTSLYYCQEALKVGTERVKFHPATGYTFDDQESKDKSNNEMEADNNSIEQSVYLDDFHRNIDKMIFNLVQPKQ